MTNTVWVLNGDSGRACSGNPLATVDHQGRKVILFDAVNDEEWEWDGLIAPQWLCLPMFAIPRFYMAIAQVGQARAEIGIEAIDYERESIDLARTDRFAYSSAGQAAPPSAGHPGQFKPIRLLHNDMDPRDGVRIRFRRDADQSTGVDSAPGDLCLVSLEICDSS